MREIDLLVRAAFLYPMTGDLPVLRDAEVAVADGRIVHAGACMPEGTWRARREIGGPTAAVLPGFVNAHTHTASLVFRGRTDDVAGGSALYDVAFRMEKSIGREQWRDLAWAGSVEMIRSGFTMVNDLWYAPDLLAEACAASGLRAQIANKVFDVALERLALDDYTHHPAIGEERLREGVDFVERWHGREGGRIQARLGPHASDTCSAQLHRQLRAEANRLEVGLHVHTAQSRREVAEVRRAQGRGPLEYLRDLGVLAPDVVVAHLSFATDADLDAVAATGTNYAHTPTIYPRRGWYPRFAEIVGRGIPTGFATDWMQNDPFEMMRNAVNALRLTAGDAGAISCREALWYATVGAARIMGLDEEIGSLAAGKKADLVVVDLDRPHLQPFYGDYAALVFYARADDVVASVIDGRVVMDGRRVVTVDEAEIHRALCRHVPGWQERLGELGALRQVPDDPQASIRCVDHGELRQEVVQYIADALAAFAALGPRRREEIALEVALLGQHGLDIVDPAPKYALKTLPGSYSGLHLLAIMYAAFRQIDPAIDVGADFVREYELAQASAG